MTTDNETDPRHGTSPSRRVLCYKCEHLNDPGEKLCSDCGSHLYISCNDCGSRNERTRSRCRECNRRLHRSIFRRFSKHFIPKRRLAPVHMLMLAAAVLVAFGAIVFIAELRFPPLW